MGYEIELNEKQIGKILSRYTSMKYKIDKIIDSSKADIDIRKNYCLSFENGSEFVLKITNNSFTTPERIKGWKVLSELYKDNEIYCPQIKEIENGQCCVEAISESDKTYIAYLEEKKKYKTVWEYIKEHGEDEKEKRELEAKFDNLDFYGRVLETIGVIANVSRKLVNWPTPYCLYETFCIEDKNDENYEFAEIFYNLCKKQKHVDKEFLNSIWRIYIKKKVKFENEYRKLPKAVFQSDLNSSNVLIDEELNFSGLIDFNISGTETILNYAICESLYYLNYDDLKSLDSIETAEKYDSHFNKAMACIKKHYTFTQEENKAFLTLYNIVAPFRFPNISLFIGAIEKGETQYLDSMLRWIYKELTREDLKL